MITIIDYEAGNLRSVEKALEYLGFKAKISSSLKDILEADKLILPGVGAFGECIGKLRNARIDDCIRLSIDRGKPFLGICLGLQLLFDESEESPGAKGMSLFGGKNIKISKKPGLKIPHIGWNSIKYSKDCPIFYGIGEEPYVYFVHSYHISPESNDIICAETEYGETIPVAIHSENVYATQFHPEKSGNVGLKILKNFGNL